VSQNTDLICSRIYIYIYIYILCGSGDVDDDDKHVDLPPHSKTDRLRTTQACQPFRSSKPLAKSFTCFPPRPKINIFVTMTNVNPWTTNSWFFYDTDTIYDVKCIIKDKFGICQTEQLLFCNRQRLGDRYGTLSDLQIKDGSEFVVLVAWKPKDVWG